MTTLLHTAIRASAGSGKTFQLTNRLLALFLNDTAIDQIVAATFTRKAAGEILERVLLRLAEASSSKKAATLFGKEISVDQLTPSRILVLLATLTKRLHELRIGTLDSLFADLASSLGLELGFPPQWKIIDQFNDGELRNEAIREMLATGPTDLLGLYSLLTKGETSRSVGRQIREAVDDLYSVFLGTDERQWAPFEIPPLLESEDLQIAIAELETIAVPKNKIWEKAHHKLVGAARALDWKTFVSETLVQRIAEGAEDYSRVKIGAEFRERCSRLLEHAKASVLSDLSKQTRAVYRLLDHFHKAYAPLKSSRQAFRFEDVTYALARATAFFEEGGHGPDVAFRLGAKTQHLLLDEFQDTSPLQWKVIEPAASSIAATAEGHGFFCVGDEKQSIYGWRGGSPELFDRLRHEMPGLEWKDLSTSHRSAPPIIEAVNAVFGRLKSNPVFEGDNREAALKGAGLWSKGFLLHSTAKTKLAGYVCFRTGEIVSAEDGKDEADCFGTAARLIKDEIAKAPGATVGVLTRKNSGVARMIAELHAIGVPASQEGGNPLTDSTAVQIVLAALHFADHPGDSASRFFVANTALGSALGLSTEIHAMDSSRVAAAIRRRLLDDGLGATLADWMDSLAPLVGDWEQDRLRKLVEFAFVQDEGTTLRPSDFVRRVEEMVFEDPAAEQVRVMTIHQSKGLEFDIVVLPELDERLVGQPPSALAWPSRKGGLIDNVVRYVDQSVQSLLPAKIRDAFEDRIVRESREALCLLYVALTRAAHALFVVNAPSPANERTLPLTLAGVLRGAVGPQGPITPQTVWFELGDANWSAKRR